MPCRKAILATGEFYHVLNRSLNRAPVFSNKRDIYNFLLCAKYYLSSSPPVKFSLYRKNANKYQINLTDPIVKVLAYCLMPNHFHFILFQNHDNGIRTYIQKLSNSYVHYINLKAERKGALFESTFKAIRIESEEQLIHLSRYIHLNPVTACLVERPQDYEYSSFSAYMGSESLIPLEPSLILSQFSNLDKYKNFVLARVDYQRRLDEIKHILLEKTKVYPGS